MVECKTCGHAAQVHDSHGCHVEGCACDELQLPEIAPDVQPPKPGACVHIMGGDAVWVIDEIDEIEEKLNESPEFLGLTGCDFEESAYCTYPLRIRPMAIFSYHGFLQERWDRVLEAIR